MTAVLDLKVGTETALRSFVLDVGVIRRADAGEVALLKSVQPSVAQKQALASPGGVINTKTDDETFQKVMNVFHLGEFTMAQVKALALGQSLMSPKVFGVPDIDEEALAKAIAPLLPAGATKVELTAAVATIKAAIPTKFTAG